MRLPFLNLALVKWLVGRPKDLDLLRTLFKMGLLEAIRLRRHYQETPLGECEALAAGRNLTRLLSEIESPS
jgi:hypothetical protein